MSKLFQEQRNQLANIQPLSLLREFNTLPQITTIQAMAKEATRAYELGYSYRNFRVGAAALYLCDERLGIKYGANFKASKECEFNRHAEQEILKELHLMDRAICRVLAISGDLQVDQHSGKHTRTLHPCGWCRDAIAKSSSITPETVIVSARPDLSVIEYGLKDEYIAFHNNESNSLQILLSEK